MQADDKTIRIEVLTPEGGRYEGKAQSVSVPCHDGLMGILPGRAPLIAELGAGTLRIVAPGGEASEYYVRSGFAQIRDDQVTLLADECIPAEQVDAEETWDEIQAARKLPWAEPDQSAYRDRRLHEARMKFRLAQKIRAERKRQQREVGLGRPDPDYD